jgi:aryl-alcohol dehydrogenase-like predicted oxidoreductase
MNAPIRGHATPAGTARYRDRHAATTASGHFRAFGGLCASSIGIGTYLGKDDAATDAAYTEAVSMALERGVNVIDTAINYRNQRSERAIGAALRRAIVDDAWIGREEIIVASKAGFLPFDGSRPPNARAYFEETYVKRGVLRWDEVVGGCHCMSPKYLRDQLERSRANLGLETIDIYYLHNLEMELDEIPAAEFDRRVRLAFETLEEAAREGKIRFYGTATWNGYRVDPSDSGHLSLDRLWKIAREAGGEEHRFRVIQVPFNPGMLEAAKKPTQEHEGRRMSLLEAARDRVYVMTSASILQGKVPDPQQALAAVRGEPGVGTALVGMKRPEHVEQITAVAKW